MSLIKRTKQLRSQGHNFSNILSICEKEGLLKANEITLPTLVRRFYKVYPSEKYSYRDRGVLPVNPKYKKEVKAVYLKHLKDMGFTDKESQDEIKRLLK